MGAHPEDEVAGRVTAAGRIAALPADGFARAGAILHAAIVDATGEQVRVLRQAVTDLDGLR